MKILSAFLFLLLCGAGWAWMQEHDAGIETRKELAVARGRLSAFDGVGELGQARPTQATPCPPTVVGQDASAELAAVARERDQYKAGLEEAAAELRRMSNQHAADVAKATLDGALQVARASAASRAAPSQPAPQRDYGRVISIRGPDLTPLGDRMMVTGTLWSNRDTQANVEATLTFLKDNQRIESTRLNLVVGPNAEVPYTHYFPFNPGGFQGNYTVAIEIR